MKKYLRSSFIALVAVLLLFSCATVEEEPVKAEKSAPVIEEEPAEEAPEPEVEPEPEAESVVEEASEAEPVTRGDRPDGVSEELEPNNDPETANYADFGKPITMSINPKGDRDWFRVFVEKQGYIRVQAKDAPKALGLEARFITYNDETDEKTEVRSWDRFPAACAVEPGEYYICIGDNYNDKASPETFQVLIDFIDEMDEAEINNSPETAFKVEPGTTVRSAIFPTGDADWFKIVVQKQGYLQTLAKDVPKALGLEVRYSTYDEWDGTTVIRNWQRVPDGCFVTPGEYYITLIDNYNDAESLQAFPFRIDFIEEIDAGEPNNKPEDATSVELGQTVQPAIYPQGDADWFKVKVEEKGYLRVTARDVPRSLGLQVRYCTYDEWDGVTVIRSWKSLPDGCPVEPGEYYICLIDNYNDAAADTSFSMRVEFLKEMDSAEPNDSPSSAKSFLPGEAKTMAIYPTGDHDYYAVELEEAGTITLQVQDVPRALGLQVSLLTPKDDNPSEYLRIDGYKRLPAEYSLDAGKQYYLQFLDNYNDASSTDTFRVKMDLE